MMVFVNAKVTVDKAGRIVLPKAVREALRLAPGDTLELSLEGQRMTLSPQRTTPPLEKEDGIWVYHTGQPITAEEMREALRRLRERALRRTAGERR